MKVFKNKGQTLYIFEAALEYLVAILCTSSFLATLTGSLGMSDSLTGIVSSFISMGCLFQLLSILIQVRKHKTFVTVLSIANQLLFTLLYVIPLFEINSNTKIIFFVVAIFGAYIIYNIAHPKKINWMMSQIGDKNHGSFTAIKQIFSLFVGMIFSFAMGKVIDHFTDKGDKQTAFIIAAIVIFVLMILHSLTLLFSNDLKAENTSSNINLKNIFGILKDKDALSVMIFFIIYYAANGITSPYYGTYKINELGMSLTLISLLTILGSFTRIFVERPFGKYADKFSFARMTEKCLIFLGLAYLCMTIAHPSNGTVMVVLYLIFHSMAMAGISSALINLVFEFVKPEKRTDALAMTQGISGIVGFLATLLVSPVVSLIQSRPDKCIKLGGINIYAQQILSFAGLIIIVIGFIYVRTVLVKKKSK